VIVVNVIAAVYPRPDISVRKVNHTRKVGHPCGATYSLAWIFMRSAVVKVCAQDVVTIRRDFRRRRQPGECVAFTKDREK